MWSPPTERPRIAVFRALALGDFLCAVPALRAIRAGNPDARISLIGLGRSRELVHRFRHVVDELVEFPGYPGIPEAEFRPETLPPFLARVHARPFDLAINLHGDGTTSNSFVALLGARRAAGFIPSRGWQPAGDGFIPYPAHLHEIHRNLALAGHLGYPVDGDQLEFPVAPRDAESLRRTLGNETLDGNGYVVIHPGASTPARRWPVEDFATVADTIAGMGYRVVLTGSRGERAITENLGHRMHRPPLDLAGRTDLGGLAALIQGARLLVANDTGVAHIAVGVGTPSVVIFSGSDPARWAPLDARLHVALGAGVPDAFAGPVAPSDPNLRSVPNAPSVPTRADVVAAAVRLLQEGDARAA